MKRQLIVNADDYGRSPGISRGIRDAHKHGIVSTTTVMINLPGAVEELKRAAQDVPALGLGVHLNLTLGTPCAEPSQVPSLVGPHGRFHERRVLLDKPELLSPAEIEREWELQIQRFLAAGLPLDHLDSHHHIAVRSSHIWQICLTLAQKYGCGVRPPVFTDVSEASMREVFPPSALTFVLGSAAGLLQRAAVPYPDQLMGSFFSTGATLETLARILHDLPEGCSEIMCHPGYPEPELQKSSGYAQERVREYEILTDPRVKAILTERSIELSTYRQAWST